MNTARVLTSVKRNIRRTPYQALAACMIMFFTFLVLTLFSILTIGSQEVLNYYETKPQAIAFFKDTATDQDISAIQAALRTTGKVTSLNFVSKEEALEIYREKNKSNPVLLELVTANILPSSLEISTQDPEDLGPIVSILKEEPIIEEVVYPEDVVKTLAQTTSAIRYVGLSTVAFLLAFSMLAILTLIGFKIRVQRNEIETMKLLGASSWFIRAPFLIEGAFYGILGAFLAWIASYAIIWYSTPFMENFIKEPQLFPVPLLFMLELLGINSTVALAIGAIGSYMALRRYLKL